MSSPVPNAGPSAGGSSGRGTGRMLVALACVVGAVRFVRLGEWSLWLDEVLTLNDALHGEDFANPVGYWLYRLFLGFVEGRPNELELRALPAVFGWLAIPLTYAAFRPFAGARAAGGAALIVACSTWHVYWSQTARFYTLAQDLALAGGGLFLRGLWRDRPGLVVAGLAFGGAAAATHPTAAFVVAGLVAAPWVLALFRVRVPGVPGRPGWILLVVALVGVAVSARWAWGILEEWMVRKGEGFESPLHFVQTTGFHMTPALGAAALVGTILALRRRSSFDLLAVAVCALVAGTGLVASLYVRVSAQYVFVALPWAAVVACAPLGRIGRERDEEASAPAGLGLLRGGYLALLALPMLADTYLYLTVGGGHRPRWREAYAWVFDQRGPGDLVVGMEAPVGEYYVSPEATEVRELARVAYLDYWRPAVPQEWTRYGRRTWIVVNVEQLEDWEPHDRARMLEFLASECRLARAFPLQVEARDLDVLVYLRE